jgi:hypothetical protein
MKVIEPRRIKMRGIDDRCIQNLKKSKLGRRDHAYGRIILKCVLQENPDCVIRAWLPVRVLFEHGMVIQVPSDAGKPLLFQ